MGSTLLAFVDVKKAYDNVDLDILDRIIRSMHPPQDVLLEWNDEYQDLKMLNMDVCGDIIKRSNGLPQGSELAPALFNIYTTYILEQLEILFPSQEYNYEVAVFADNWVLISDTNNEQEMKDLISEINMWMYDNFKLEFTIAEQEIQKATGFKDKKYANSKESDKIISFLGIKWHFNQDNKIYFDYKDYIWNFPPMKMTPAYTTIKMTKRFLVPKFRYYYDYLNVVNKNEANEFLKWFRAKLRKYLQKQLNYIKISKELLDEIIYPTNQDHIWRKFLTPYLQKENEIWNGNGKLNLKQTILLEKLRQMARYCFETSIKIGCYQATNFLFSNKTPQIYFKNNPRCETKRQRNRTWMVLDLLYYAITCEKRISTVIFKEQTNYMNRTIRKRTYKFF